MKTKFLYYVEFWTETQAIQDSTISVGGYGYTTRLCFALATNSPEEAIQLILSSSQAKAVGGRLSNFTGPQGKAWAD